jgi:hypothetical protein
LQGHWRAQGCWWLGEGLLHPRGITPAGQESSGLFGRHLAMGFQLCYVMVHIGVGTRETQDFGCQQLVLVAGNCWQLLLAIGTCCWQLLATG